MLAAPAVGREHPSGTGERERRQIRSGEIAVAAEEVVEVGMGQGPKETCPPASAFVVVVVVVVTEAVLVPAASGLGQPVSSGFVQWTQRSRSD